MSESNHILFVLSMFVQFSGSFPSLAWLFFLIHFWLWNVCSYCYQCVLFSCFSSLWLFSDLHEKLDQNANAMIHMHYSIYWSYCYKLHSIILSTNYRYNTLYCVYAVYCSTLLYLDVNVTTRIQFDVINILEQVYSRSNIDTL